MILLIVAIVVALLIFSLLKELAPFILIVLAIGWVMMKLHVGALYQHPDPSVFDQVQSGIQAGNSP